MKKCIRWSDCKDACGRNQWSTGMMNRLVLSEVKTCVENTEITIAQTITGSHRLIQLICGFCTSMRQIASEISKLLEPVVGRFARNDHVVDVAFSQARRRYANEAGFFLKLFQVRRAAVPHAAPEASHKLVN